MKTTIVFVVYLAVFNGIVFAQSLINGSWTTYYGGNFYMCADDDSGEVNGVYSELGYIKGTLSDATLRGDWFQTGLNSADLNGLCCTPNRGTFTFSFVTGEFSGSYLFEQVSKGGEDWSGTRKSSVTPLNSQCWAPIETLTTTIAGQWDSDFTNTWDQCISADGQWTASYEYGTARTRGYIFGKCFYDGQFCHGDWFEPGRINGGYMVRLIANNQMAGSWWQFNASDFTSTTYSQYATNPSYHGGEIRNRLGEAVGCNRNSDLFFYGSSSLSPLSPSTGAPELPAGAIIGIVVGVVGAVLIAGIVLLCVFCRCCSGGGGGGGGGSAVHHSTTHHHRTTRRHGFGWTHRRYGGGYA